MARGVYPHETKAYTLETVDYIRDRARRAMPDGQVAYDLGWTVERVRRVAQKHYIALSAGDPINLAPASQQHDPAEDARRAARAAEDERIRSVRAQQQRYRDFRVPEHPDFVGPKKPFGWRRRVVRRKLQHPDHPRCHAINEFKLSEAGNAAILAEAKARGVSRALLIGLSVDYVARHGMISDMYAQAEAEVRRS